MSALALIQPNLFYHTTDRLLHAIISLRILGTLRSGELVEKQTRWSGDWYLLRWGKGATRQMWIPAHYLTDVKPIIPFPVSAPKIAGLLPSGLPVLTVVPKPEVHPWIGRQVDVPGWCVGGDARIVAVHADYFTIQHPRFGTLTRKQEAFTVRDMETMEAVA